MTTAEKAKQKSEFSLSRRVTTVLANRNGRPSRIQADTSGNLPTSFELLKVGMWRTPNHGDIMIMPDDLQEYVDNWKEGYGVSGNNTLKLPINFNHDEGGKAAGWFNLAIEGDTLMAVDVEWTVSGAEGLKNGEWKCISAEFWPAGRGGWPDPLDYDNYVDNVIDGAALTNIPLFSQLKPVMASATSGKGDDNNQVFFITASKNKEKSKMAVSIEEVRGKKVSELNEEQKAFAAEHKADFTADEQKALGLEVAAPAPDAPAADDPKPDEQKPNTEENPVNTPASEVPAQVAASLKSGESVVVKASTLKSLEETDKAYRNDKAREIVKAHVARGALKADQIDVWSGKLVASVGSERVELEKMLKDLPDNQVAAAKIGSEKDEEEMQEEQLHIKTKNKLEASRKDGHPIPYSQARKEVISEINASKESK